MKSILILFFSLFYFAVFGQGSNKTLLDEIDHGGIISIYIDHGSERYERTEASIIYHADSFLKIHCVLLSNSKMDKPVDTVFNLTPKQWDIINRFSEAVDSNNIPSRLIMAGTSSRYFITVNGRIKNLSDKSNYSLVFELLGLDY
jgi:hypothetical protein